jgi:hypothetical protein
LGVRHADHPDVPPELWNVLVSLMTSLFRGLIKLVKNLRVEGPGCEQERLLFVDLPELLFGLIRELANWWWSYDRGFLGTSLTCPKCQGHLRYKGDVEKEMITPYGAVRPRRAYYWCPRRDCDYSVSPLDQRLGLDGDSFLPSVQKIVVWLTSLDPYGKCLDFVANLLQFRISHRSAWLLTQKVGNIVKAREDEEIARAFADPNDPKFPAYEVDAVPKVGVVMMDGTCGRIDREEVQDEESVEEDDPDAPARPPDFREVKLGLVAHLEPPSPKKRSAASASAPETPVVATTSRTRQRKRRRKVRAEGDEPTLSHKKLAVHLGTPLRLFQLILLLVHRLGVDKSETIVVIGDGAHWIWRGVRLHLGSLGPAVVEILDYYHAVEHLWKVANSLFGHGTAEAVAWVRGREEDLLKGLDCEFFKSLREALATAKGISETLASSVEKELNYFINNKDRIKYAEYISKGYLIGSGAMEGSCKHHVKERIDRAGMHWSPQGAMAVLRNRTLVKNADWDKFWADNAHRTRLSYATLKTRLTE